MNYYVGIVEDRPSSALHALAAAGNNFIFLFELFFQMFGKGFNLSFRPASRDYEIVAKAGLFFYCDINYIVCLSVG